MILIKFAGLDATGEGINIKLDIVENREDTNLIIDLKHIGLLTDRKNSKHYLQSLQLKAENVSLFASGDEEMIQDLAENASSILVMIMLITVLVAPSTGISIIKLFQMADFVL